MSLPAYKSVIPQSNDRVMTQEEIQSIIKQKEKVDSIKLIAESMLFSGNWFSKAAKWAIEHETLEEADGMKEKWQEIKSHYQQLKAIMDS